VVDEIVARAHGAGLGGAVFGCGRIPGRRRRRVGGVDLTIVYCTLCGTVIPFESQSSGRRFHFGTSGLRYRSNKLIFDEKSNSLWSTCEGVPVVGPLVGSSVSLTTRAVVTTTWKER
jgi:hypothetical protein